MEWIIGILSGLVSGVVLALTIWLLKIVFFRPNIKISSSICECEKVYKIKIVNCSKFKLLDLSYSLTSREKNTSKTIVKRIYPKFLQTYTYIPGYRKNKKYSRYSIIISFKKTEIDRRLKNACELEFVVSGKHSFSGLVSCVIQTFNSDNIKKGQFVEGISMEIVSSSNTTKTS